MSSLETSRMNTKFVGHHISSGGFIFNTNAVEKKIYVVLLKNKKGEWWIPKGHLEEGEDQVSAAFREIEEEVGLDASKIEFIDFSHLYTFSFKDAQGEENTKGIYMNVFRTQEMYELRVEEAESDVVDVNWFEYSEALSLIIPFSKDELIKAKEIYDNYMSKQF